MLAKDMSRNKLCY